jgi:hypothetical protein
MFIRYFWGFQWTAKLSRITISISEIYFFEFMLFQGFQVLSTDNMILTHLTLISMMYT